jgi:hypothetical protein
MGRAIVYDSGRRNALVWGSYLGTRSTKGGLPCIWMIGYCSSLNWSKGTCQYPRRLMESFLLSPTLFRYCAGGWCWVF